MKNEDIYDGITNIRDDIVEKTEKHKFKKKRNRPFWIASVAAVLAIVIAIGIPSTTGNSEINDLFSPVSAKATVISAAEYPDMMSYPDDNGDYEVWRNEREAFASATEYKDSLDSFLSTTIPHFLSENSGNNRVYSPLSVYMALGILAELTDGNSRQQILDLLNCDSIETLRSQADALWRANYYDDGRNTSILAGSLWLNQNVNFEQSTMDLISQTYRASSYRGEMGSSEYTQAFQDWLNKQTDGLLKDNIGEIELNADTILALATTIYYQARWSDEFSESLTSSGIFYSDSGEITCDFMYQSNSRKYYEGETFTAVGQKLDGSGSMYFILPNENEMIDTVLNDSDTMDFILSNKNDRPGRFLTVNLTVPKFDVASQLELTENLKDLGVTDVFNDAKSDFSSMTSEVENIYVSQVQHNARVMIDEEGCTATAFTAMLTEATSAPPSDEIDFTLDRPFIFIITGADGLPLFVGVVNQPS